MRPLLLPAFVALPLALFAVPVVRAQPSSMPPVTGKIEKYYGVRFIDIVVGTGPAVTSRKCVFAHYTGWLKDGTRFESSRDSISGDASPAPVAFVLGIRHVMEGWDVGFSNMKVGGRRRLLVPFALAYGEAGRPPIPPRADLTFDVEVMAVSDTLPRAAGMRANGAAGPQCPSWNELANTRK